MKKTFFTLAFLALGASVILADEAWSDAIEFNCASVGTTIQLLPIDLISYSTLWAEGEERIATVSACSASTDVIEIFSTDEDGDEGVFSWDYTSETYSDLPTEETYTLTHAVSSGADVLDTKTAVVTLLPEPALVLLGLLAGALFIGKRRVLAACALAIILSGNLRADLVSGVSIASRWPWEAKVDIDYTINGSEGTVYDVAFYGKEGDGDEFALTTLSGDGAEGMVAGPGNYRVTWDTAVDTPEAVYSALKVKVVAKDPNALDDNTVKVVYDGDTATVSIADNIADYVSASIKGADVTLTQSTNVSAKTCGEITYNVTGSSDDGSFLLTGSFKATVNIEDLNLTSSAGSPFDIENGKRIDMTISGTNSFVDSANGSQKACLVVKGHPEVKGSGMLTVTGNKKHAIKTGEYLQLKPKFTGSIIVAGAAGDGLHIGQYFEMNNGLVTVEGAEDDCIQIEANEEGDDFDGQCFLMGGAIELNVTAADVKGLKCDDAMLISNATINISCASTATAAKGLKSGGDMTILGGTINVVTAGNGMWDSSETNTTACAGIKCDGNLSIQGGTFVLSSSGSGGKGINVDGDFSQTGGDITITTTGGLYYSDGTTENHNYTGSTDNISSDYTSSPKGIKVDGDIVIDGGKLNISTSGNNAEGLESKKHLTISGGEIVINSYDDCINSKSNMFLKGGTITCVAKDNDAIDSNANMYISGGTIIVCGARSPECGLDAAEHYNLYITGGYVMAIGGGNNSVTVTSDSQAVVDVTLSVSANATVALKNGSTTLATFTVPSTYSASSGGGGPGGGPGGGRSEANVLISTPDLVSGTTYTVTCGSNSATGQASTSYEGSMGDGGRPGGH